MREEDAVFGGEHSGHFYFRDNWYADSGIIAALTVLQLVSEQGKPVLEVLAPLDTRFRSGEINTKVRDAKQLSPRLKQSLPAKAVRSTISTGPRSNSRIGGSVCVRQTPNLCCA